jgi:hypothetical protein
VVNLELDVEQVEVLIRALNQDGLNLMERIVIAEPLVRFLKQELEDLRGE